MSRISRWLAIAFTTLVGILLGAGTAYAVPAPLEPDAGSAQVAIVAQPLTVEVSSPLWQFAVVAVFAAVVAAATVAAFMTLAARRGSHGGAALAH